MLSHLTVPTSYYLNPMMLHVKSRLIGAVGVQKPSPLFVILASCLSLHVRLTTLLCSALVKIVLMYRICALAAKSIKNMFYNISLYVL